MKKNASVLLKILVGIISVFFATSLYAAIEVADVIKMENKAYSKHKKGIVEFSHKKHSEDYKAGCGECHHDADNKPLDSLKMGDDVQNCIECHKKPEYITGKKAKGLSKADKMAYHGNAMHKNCKGCHKKFNKGKGLKSKDPGAAPTTCKSCHPKKAQ